MQSRIRKIWRIGHYTHEYYPTPLFLTANEGWRAYFPSFFGQLLAFFPFLNNFLAFDTTTPIGFSVKSIGATMQNISIMRVCQTASALENHFLPSICNSCRSIGTCQVLGTVSKARDSSYTYFRILCFLMQGVWWFSRTCLLAVQNFFWKNSSFIWMPTAERGTTHTETWWQGTFMFGALKSVICITKDIIPRARKEGGRERRRERDYHTDSMCIFH